MKKPFPFKHSWLNRIQCYSPGLWFSLTISLFAPTVVAQTNLQGSTPPFNTVTMPSPNAASLGTFGDITIGYHVGTPNIDVPIYELKQGDLNVPISLKYQPGGIKVADIPSWVGSGWALIAGGVITRSIVGLPDEFNRYSPSRKLGFLYSIPFLSMNGYPQSYPCEYITETLSSGELDTEPDIFHFNFNGISGRFHFSNPSGQDFTIAQAEEQNISISPIILGSNIFGWKIISEEGSTFFFDLIESSEQVVQGNESESLGSVKTSWYLSKILSANKKDSILLSYSPMGQSVIVQRSARDFRSAYVKDNYGGNGNSTITTSISTTTTGTLYLASIKTHNQIVSFEVEPTEGRGDDFGNSPFRLKTVNIGTYRNALENNLKSYRFDYVVTGARLFLNKVQEFVGNNASKPPYEFMYDATPLPSFSSNDFDAWGYYNGAQNEKVTTDLRKLLPEVLVHASWGSRYQPGAKRSPDSLFVKAGTLVQIKYPTGGKTKFDWEAHTFSGYISDQGYEPVSWAIGNNGNPFSFSFSNENPNLPSNPPTWPYPVIATYRISCNSSAGCSLPTICDQIFSAGARNGSLNDYGEFSLVLPAGTPLFASNLLGGVLPDASCQYSVSVMGEVRPILSTGIATAGGLRIKTIRNFDGNDQLLRRDFGYGGGILGSGFMYSYLLSSSWSGGDPGAAFLYARESTPILSLSVTQGSHVAYTTVVETRQDGSRTVYEYSNFDSFPDLAGQTNIVIPTYTNSQGVVNPCLSTFVPTFMGVKTSNEVNRGRLLRTSYFDSSNFKVFEEENEYFDNAPAQTGTTCFSFKYLGSVSGTQVSIGFANTYRLFTKLVLLKKSTTREFLQSGIQKSTQKTFDYGINNFRPYQINIETSDGRVKRTKLEYSAIIKSLPIHQSEWIVNNGTEYLVSGSNIQLDPVAIKPQSVFVAEFAQPQTQNNSSLFKLRYEYNYNSDGRQISARKLGDYPISYIWAPDNNFVYAEVQNALVNEIFHTSFEEGEEGGNSLFGDARTGNTSKIGGYTKVLNGLTPNKAYTLTYWQKDSSKWILQSVNVPANPATNYTINLSGQVDEVRFCPQGALMTTYTYKRGVGPTSMCDSKGLITTYDYDYMNRLWLVKDHFGKIVKENKYNYKQ